MSESRRGTVGLYNFIRRIGFPSTGEVLSVFVALTDGSISRRIFASLVVPLFVSVALVVSGATQMLATIIALSLVSAASIAGVLRFVQEIDQEGSAEIGAPPLQLFRAFLLHWLNRDPDSLEDSLTTLDRKSTR